MRLSAIHLFPVKAMAGHTVAAWPVTEGRLAGDRGWAVLDDAGRIGTGKDTRRFRRLDPLFTWAARLDRPGGVPEVACPAAGIDWTPADDPAVAAALSAQVGEPVRVREESESGFAATEKGYLDDSPVSLVGTATLTALGELLGGPPVDPRHLRANLVVETAEPYVEEGWLGREITLGAARFVVTKQVTRCRMVDIAQADLPELPGLLKATGSRAAHAAVYLRPVAAATLTLGDDLTVGGAATGS